VLNRAAALERIRELARTSHVAILRMPQVDMEGLGYDLDDVCDCISSLGVDDVEKDEDDQYRPECRVYVFKRIRYDQDDLYVKVSVPDAPGGRLIVLSFKLWGSPR
jgi:hypothetical protein